MAKKGQKGELYIIATPIGNLNDVSQRAIQILNDVDAIICEDTRHSKKLLTHFNIQKKLISYHGHSIPAKTGRLVGNLESGYNMAYITDGGTPCISDPGHLLVKKCHEKGLKVIAIPGPCAAISALSMSGISAKKFLFLGFLSKKKGKRLRQLIDIKEMDAAIILYESAFRLVALMECIAQVFTNKTVYVAKEMTKLFEQTFYGEIEKVCEKIVASEIKGEYTIIISNYKKK